MSCLFFFLKHQHEFKTAMQIRLSVNTARKTELIKGQAESNHLSCHGITQSLVYASIFCPKNFKLMTSLAEGKVPNLFKSQS